MSTPEEDEKYTEQATDTASPVLGFQLDGTRVPLFFVRTWFNEAAGYERLARHLGPDQPIYTFAPPRGTTRADMPPTAEAWSELILGHLREIDYDGPYVLGGWSFGGVVALELARTLRAAGADIRRVLMIDTWRPRHRPGNRGTVGTIILHLNRLFDLDRDARRTYIRKRVRKKLATLRVRRGPGEAQVKKDPYGTEHIVTNRGTRMSLLRRAVWVAHYKYQSPRADLPVSLYWSQGSRNANNDSALGWIPTLYGDFEAVRIPGDHFTVFDEPHVATLAARIKQTLEVCAPELRTAPASARESAGWSR